MADVQTNLRIPAELKEALLAAATRNNRSLSAEVIFRLVHSFSMDAGLLQPSEPEEMRREKLALEMRLDTVLSRLNVLEMVAALKSEQGREAHREGDRKAEREAEEEGLRISRERRAVKEQADGIKARLAEIEADLQLPEVPSAIAKLANLMPR